MNTVLDTYVLKIKSVMVLWTEHPHHPLGSRKLCFKYRLRKAFYVLVTAITVFDKQL